MERFISRGGKIHLPGESADSGNALILRVFRVFRGLNCFFQAESNNFHLPDYPPLLLSTALTGAKPHDRTARRMTWRSPHLCPSAFICG
jgi:hypothetical protein